MNKWNNNKIQFPRLLAEIASSSALTDEVMSELRESMDLSNDEINELFDRAQNEWNRIKEEI